MGRQLHCEIRLELASRDLAGGFIQVCPSFRLGCRVRPPVFGFPSHNFPVPSKVHPE